MSVPGRRQVADFLRSLGPRFRADERGQIAIIFGLSVTAIVLAAGGGIDLARAFHTRQKLSEIATLACQYASRPSVIQTIAPSYSGSNGGTAYNQNVQNYISQAFGTQQIPTSYSPTTTSFTYSSTGPADLTLSATVPTAFMRIARINTMAVGATSHCYDSPSTTPTNGNNPSPYIVQEGFENSSCTGTCYSFTKPDGTNGTKSTPTTSFPSTVGYTGTSGQAWYITGYCIEIDAVRVINSTVPEGTHSAELDCDSSTSADRGNSAISTKTSYLSVGNYELRYNFASRVGYPDYDPAYICGSTASDLVWATSTNSVGSPVSNALRTNQINVYFDLAGAGGAAPGMHTTIDASQQLAGVNLIDMCVHSSSWIERSVRIYVTTPGYYWLTFAADGQNDSYGGQLDNIRLCVETCPGAVQDDFPTAWLAANNAGSNKVLFEDRFESPTYSQDCPYHNISKSGNLNLSLGTSGTSASGWPGQSTSGWATAPYNQVNYGTAGAYEGSQHIMLDGYNASGTSNRNRLISRPFILDPGYYKVEYDYISIVDFGGAGVSATFCWNAPASGTLFGPQATYTGQIRYYNSTVTDGTTNVVGAFMSHSRLISTPIGGGALHSVTSYLNLDGTTSTIPAVAPDGVNYANYDATAVNPLLDACGYADSFRWVPRSVTVKITKPGTYWLTFSANGGTADGNGGGIDDVKLTALGSLYMAAPSNAVTIPVPDPQPGSKLYFTGFYIVADPLTQPAALQ